ncbi:MAG TPA: GNAT family N-acetyltransferase [Pseudonocardiaceae bacterium]|nr:GNAT family N-acetyltransferase [Pseudonocardiaceae bacterium]
MPDVPAYRIAKAAGSPELAAITEKLLAALPNWFGIPEANAEYVAAATRLPGYVAHAGDDAVGILLCERHFPESAEIHLMAVDPAWHRKGVGRALVDALIDELRPTGCRLLQVKTLGPSRPDAGYAKTREFYRAVGFLPLEELADLWPGNPCLIMAQALVRPE